MKKIFTFLFSIALFVSVQAQCVATDFASLQNCFNQTGTVNITVSANISLTGNLVMSNATTYNLTLGSFDITRNGQSYTGGDASTSIVVSGKTIVNGSGGLTISGLNTSATLKTYIIVNPVELLFFTATTQKNGAVKMEWQTASESGASYFDIERSVDARSWSRIANVKANNKPSYYSTSDDTPLSIGAYYRLKQVDFDGKFEIFKNVFVEQKVNKLTVYPNPTLSEITIVSENTIQVFDTLGRLYLSFEKGSIKVSSLLKGVYIVRSGTEMQRIIVQ